LCVGAAVTSRSSPRRKCRAAEVTSTLA
jgi:hypothetical protein